MHLVVSSSLVLSVISKDPFLTYYIDDSNAKPLAMPKENKSANAVFTFSNSKRNVVNVLDTGRKNLSTPSPAAVTYS